MLHVARDEGADEEDEGEGEEVDTAEDHELGDELFDFLSRCLQSIADSEHEVDVHAKTQHNDHPSCEPAVRVEFLTLIVSDLAQTHDHHVHDT